MEMTGWSSGGVLPRTSTSNRCQNARKFKSLAAFAMNQLADEVKFGARPLQRIAVVGAGVTGLLIGQGLAKASKDLSMNREV